MIMTNIGELLERAAEEIEIRVTKTRVLGPTTDLRLLRESLS